MLAEFHQVSRACTTCQRSARLLALQRMFCLTRPGGWMTATIHLPKCTPHPASWHVSSRSHLAFRVCHSLILLARLQDRANTKDSQWRPLRIVRSLRTLLTVRQSCEYGITPHEVTMKCLFKYWYGYVRSGIDPLVMFDRKFHC